MEYRGYDSVGVATKSDNQIRVKKGVGKVSEVNQRVNLDALHGTVGVGHTRWATHGMVTNANAHPHTSNSGEIAIVHNGIIDNFEELKRDLQAEGYVFESETDSEVIANLLQKHYESSEHNVKDAVMKTIAQIDGHYAFVAMFRDGQLAAAKFHEPLIIGIGRDELFLSSDVLGFIEYTGDAVYVENGNFMILDDNGFQILDFNGVHVPYEITKVAKEFGDVYKGQYAHFTLQEINDQPATILAAGANTTDAIRQIADHILRAQNIYVTGSGTSYNAALVAKQILAKYAGIKVEPILSSELQFSSDSMERGSALIAISQSGESADVLDAVRIAKDADCKVAAIVNIMTSSLVREADIVIGMNCGPEIGVASTKSFTSQLVILYKLAEMLGGHDNGSSGNGSSGNGHERARIRLDDISNAVAAVLKDTSMIQQIAKKLRDTSDIYVLGRGVHYPIAIESALKLKELTYIHAEGIPGGELKHGPLALMDSNVFVVIINPNDSTYPDTLTSAREIKARGAKIIGVSDINNDIYDYWMQIPNVDELSYPIIEIVPIQLLSYYAAVERNIDPDYPRNLAKSVTVK